MLDIVWQNFFFAGHCPAENFFILVDIVQQNFFFFFAGHYPAEIYFGGHCPAEYFFAGYCPAEYFLLDIVQQNIFYFARRCPAENFIYLFLWDSVLHEVLSFVGQCPT